MKSRAFALGLSLLCSISPISAIAAETEKLSILSIGEVVGTVEAITDGNRISVDYRVDNNGRGPKHKEDIVLSDTGVPVSWTVSGSSLMGGPVDERYSWSSGKAQWKSQADAGSIKSAKPPVYILNDDSPYATAIYAKLALRAPGNTLSVLPAGSMKLAKVKDATIGTGDKQVAVTFYELSGLQLSPTYVAFDAHGQLFAVFDSSDGGSGSTVVRTGYEALAPELGVLSQELETQRVEGLQRKLAHKPTGPLRVTNVRVFDPATGALSNLSTVVVMGDRVVQVLEQNGAGAGAVPDDEATVDGQGGTVYPGLHDMHSHATLDSGLLYLAAGVTATRDMGNDNAFMRGLLNKIDAGSVAWPRIVPSGFMEGRSPYSARFGFIPASLPEAIKDVGWYADHGYPEIKIYNSFNPDWVRPVADEAHRRGRGVAGHVPAFSSPDRVIADGYNAIAHINQLMLGWILDPKEDTRTPLRLTAMARAGKLDLNSPPVRVTVDAMKAHGTALDTTAVILEMLMLSNPGQIPSFAEHYFDHMPVSWQRFRMRGYVDKSTPEARKAYEDGFSKTLEVIGMLNASGVRLLPGTDETTGLTLLRELELYVKAGLTPAQALRTATLGAEEYFGRSSELGSVSQGKLADFVLVAGDPTKDITEIYRPRMVVHNGVIYFPPEIHAALGIKPFATAPRIRPAAKPGG